MSGGGFFPQNLQQPYEYEEDFGFASKIDELMDKKFEMGEEFEEEEDYDNADTFGDVDDTFGGNNGYDKDFDFTAGNSFFESKREEEHGKYVVPEFEDNHNDEAFVDDVPVSQDFTFSNLDEHDEFQKFKQQQQVSENQEPNKMWGGIQENLPETQTWPGFVNNGVIDSHPTFPQPSNVQPKTIQEIEAQMVRSRNNQNHAINAQAMYLENLKLQQQSRQEALTLAEVEAQLRMQQQHQHQQQASMHMHPNVMPMEGLQGIQDMARISQIQQQRIQQLQQMQFQLMQQRQLQQMEFQRLQMLQEEQQGLQRSNSLTGNQGMRQHPNPLLQQPQQFAQPQFSQQARQTQSSPQPRPQFREQQYRDQQYSTRNPPARQQMRLYNAPQSVHTQGARGRNEYIHLQNRHLEENRSLNGYGRDAYIREDKRSREERYNGLMTSQEKELIARIQISQLVGDNPDVDDFYYQVYMNGVKRKNENGGETVNWQQGLQKGGGNFLSQIKMKMERLIENRKKERPKGKHLALEGSLGKISLNSVKHPRQMLSVMTKDIMKEREHVDYGPSKTLSRKAILLRVEKVYSLVLALEQLDREGPMEDLEEWAQQVESKKIGLWEELRIAENSGYGVIHPFVAFVSVSKGKKIISRIIRYLTAEQILGMVVVIFSRMEFLDVCSESPDKNEMNLFLQNIVPSIVGFISELPLPVINKLTQTILQNHEVRWVCTKKIGLIILTLLLSRAEILKQSIPTGQPAIEKDLMVWNELYGYLFSRLYGGFAELFTNFESKFTDGVGIEDDEVYVWQFLSAVAVGAATMEQQRILVIEMRDRIIEKSKVEKSLAHVNLFLSALGLGIDATQLAGVE